MGEFFFNPMDPEFVAERAPPLMIAPGDQAVYPVTLRPQRAGSCRTRGRERTRPSAGELLPGDFASDRGRVEVA